MCPNQVQLSYSSPWILLASYRFRLMQYGVLHAASLSVRAFLPAERSKADLFQRLEQGPDYQGTQIVDQAHHT